MEGRTFQGRHAALKEFETAIASDSAIWRQYEWGDMRVGYETYLRDFDDAELLKGLPSDRCPCPHWGYLLAGKLTVRYADHEELVQAGEVYYMAPRPHHSRRGRHRPHRVQSPRSFPGANGDSRKESQQGIGDPCGTACPLVSN